MDISFLYSLGVEELWELFYDEMMTKISESKRNADTFRFVKEGGKIKCDIELMINNIGIITKVKQQKVLINKKVYSLSEFFEEMRNRKLLMRRWLMENIENLSLTSARERIEKEVEA